MNTTTDIATFPMWVSSDTPVVATDQLSDLTLAQRASKGDTAAYEELFNRHHRRVYSLCLRMLRNTAEAEDLTQEVFIQVFRKISSFRGDSAFTTWLHTTTRNQVLMHFRKRIVKNEAFALDEVQAEPILQRTMRSFHFSLEAQIALDAAIKRLPDGYRNVFILHDIEGYEHEEVARILGCSVGTSKSQLHKARLRVRQLLLQKKNPKGRFW